MFWGLVLVSGVAFSCSTEFIPEINERLKLVPFSPAFKLTMTTVMILDYAGCWVIETMLKQLFSDFRPKDIALRRPDQLEREEKRAALEKAAQAEAKQRADEARRKEAEKKLEAWGLKPKAA